jgi:hypothetical protein
MPDDWVIWQSELAKHSINDGREALQTAIDELRVLGYIDLKIERDELGRIQKFAYEVHEEPIEVDAETVKKIEQKRENKKAREQRKQDKRKQKQLEHLKLEVQSNQESDQETGNPFMVENFSTPQTGFPQMDTPFTVNPSLLNTNLNERLTKQITDYTTDEMPVVVVEGEIVTAILLKIKDALGTKATTMLSEKEVSRWLSDYGEAYIDEKIDIVRRKRETNIPLQTLRAAIRDNWSKESNTSDFKTPVRGFAKSGASVRGAASTDRVVPAAQEGKYKRFYEIYGKNLLPC